jgi:serine carboxypeptidase-like clade 2
LKGLLVGNAWTNALLDNTGAVDFWYTRTMISKEVHDGILLTCNMSGTGPLAKSYEFALEGGVPSKLGFTANEGNPTYNGLTCDDYETLGFDSISGIDIYDAFSNICVDSTTTTNTLPYFSSFEAALTYGASTDSNLNSGAAAFYEPCIDNYIQTYLNRPDVVAAIGADPSTLPWVDCTSQISYSRYDLLTSVLPVCSYLFKNWPQGRWLTYSGTVDAIVPTDGTKLWIAALGLPTLSNLTAWNTPYGQVGGWTQSYVVPGTPMGGAYAFATVRNAGHFVPEMQGQRSAQLAQAWLTNSSLTSMRA